ncbi:MAG: Gfo/Idh/MocA family oxidoreductase [Bacteroidetes bacterium]|jgi:predicted dehydrogenase|nr:Gfo/Idh/MocA family oxidoreductase [Bacteroidota bacterium]
MKLIEGEIHWGIIGCGDVCEIKSGPAFQKVTDSKLVAVMRRDGEKAKDFAQRHGVPKYYDNAQNLMADPEVNAIYIATPPVYHEEYAIMAMKAGKPVYIEKPVAINAASCERMLKYSNEHNIPAVCAHYRRRLPLFLKVKELIQEGQIGDIQLINLTLLQSPKHNVVANTEENWRINLSVSGGGLFHDLAPHQLDIMYWLFGKPKNIHAKSLNQGRQYDAADLVGMDALFDDDIYFQGIWSFHVPNTTVQDECRIIGDKGLVSFPFFGSPELQLINEKGSEEFKFENPTHIQLPFIQQVVRYFKGEISNPCSLEEGFVTMGMMDSTL